MRTARNLHQNTIVIMGSVVGAISIFSLLQAFLDFGLSKVVGDFVFYYRTLGRWVFGWIGQPFDWAVPFWLRDFWSLSFATAAIGLRSKLLALDANTALRSLLSNSHSRCKRICLYVSIYVIAGFSLLGIFVLIRIAWLAVAKRPLLLQGEVSILKDTYPQQDENDEIGSVVRFVNSEIYSSRVSILVTASALIVFFAVNAYGLSV